MRLVGQRNADDLQDFVDGMFGPHVVPDNRHKAASRYGTVYLDAHSVLACAPELLDSEVLLQPLCPYQTGEIYGVTADYLLGLTETTHHPNADLADLHLSDELIALLKNGRLDAALLCELATHKDSVKLLVEIEIYVNGIATGKIQNLNAWVDVARTEIMEKYQLGEHDKTAYLPKRNPCAGRKVFQPPNA